MFEIETASRRSGRRFGKQGFLDDHQIGQREQGVELCGVLDKAAIAQLLVAEQILNDVEGMLDRGAQLRQRPLNRLRPIPQPFW